MIPLLGRGGGGGTKSAVSVKNFNLRRTQVRNGGRLVLTSPQYAHTLSVGERVCAQQPPGPEPPNYQRFTITLRHTTLGRTPLDE